MPAGHYRDLVAMMAERGISVSHSTIHRWVIRYVPEFEKRWVTGLLRDAAHLAATVDSAGADAHLILGDWAFVNMVGPSFRRRSRECAVQRKIEPRRSNGRNKLFSASSRVFPITTAHPPDTVAPGNGYSAMYGNARSRHNDEGVESTMEVVLDWLAAGSIAAKMVLGGLIAVIVALVLIFFIAALQGREVSVWIFKIGRRDTPGKKKPAPNSEEGTIAPTGAAQTPQVSTAPSATLQRIGSPPSPMREILYPVDKGHPNITARGVSLRPKELFCESIICRTPHGLVQKCTMQGIDYVLKRTSKECYDVDAMTTLMSKLRPNVHAHVTVAVPLALWIDKYVWELLPFYDGVTLDKVILSNRYPFAGAFLGALFNELRGALYAWHEIGILHRDVCPSNLLISSRGDIILLDPSFASRTNTQQVAVSNSNYTAPEQLAKKATFQSDLYSLAATVVFLGTGNIPPTDDPAVLLQRVEQMDFGPFRPFHGGQVSSLVLSLLSADLLDRPMKSHEASLSPVSSVAEKYHDVLGIVDINRIGYFVMQDIEFQRFATELEIKDWLRKAVAYGAIPEVKVREDVDRFLAGHNPWLREV